MLFGSRQVFEYAECPLCRSLQIRTIPENLGEHYPADYYSLQPPPARARTAGRARRAWAHWLLRSPWAVWAAWRLRGKYPFFHWCRAAGCGLESRVLDVGCGSGGLLRRMQRYGFGDLTGVDLYAARDVDEPGFRLRRAELAAAGGGYDLIMLHHVLEHLPDPRQVLQDARARLTPRGRLLVRLPLAASRSCRAYREHWFNLDPPRHLLVPSRRGMEALAQRAGLRVIRTEFDGVAQGFLMSEHYRRGTPYSARPRDGFWRRRQFRARAEQANRDGDGDQGVFWLESA